LLAFSALTGLQCITLAQTTKLTNEEDTHMGRKQKNLNWLLKFLKMVLLGAGLTTLHSVGASNIAWIAAQLA
jgi:hypothetical protein